MKEEGLKSPKEDSLESMAKEQRVQDLEDRQNP